MFARCLSNLILCDFTFGLLVLSNNLIAALSLDPILGPSDNVLLDLGIALIDCSLNCSDEIRQSSVAPFMSLEVNLESVCESFPANQEDELFNQ